MNEFNGTTVLFSGGIDSTACIHFLRNQKHDVRGVFIDFGQPARDQEFNAVSRISDELNFPLKTYVLSDNEQFSSGEIFGRNAFLIFSCAMFARQQSGIIAIGIHRGTPYYDCSESFLNKISQLIEEYSDGKVRVIAPFINWRKKDVHDYFISYNLPQKLTYSCELGGDRPCGRCASCQDQVELNLMQKNETSSLAEK